MPGMGPSAYVAFPPLALSHSLTCRVMWHIVFTWIPKPCPTPPSEEYNAIGQMLRQRALQEIQIRNGPLYEERVMGKQPRNSKRHSGSFCY